MPCDEEDDYIPFEGTKKTKVYDLWDHAKIMSKIEHNLLEDNMINIEQMISLREIRLRKLGAS